MEEEGGDENQHLVDILTKVEEEGGDENQHLVDILTKVEEEGGDANQHLVDILTKVEEEGGDENQHLVDILTKVEEEGGDENQHLVDILTKVEEEGGDENQHLVDILTKVEEEGGIVEYGEDPDGTVCTIFITTHKMKSVFVKSTQTVIQVDTARYEVLAFCYLNPRTNKSEIAAISFTSNESKQNLIKCSKGFRRICTRDD